MKAFADHDMSYKKWWAALSPYLTPTAYNNFAYTDPENVPVSRVTGDPRISAVLSPTQLTILVPTDIGQYQVQVESQPEDGAAGVGWLVADITPPADAS